MPICSKPPKGITFNLPFPSFFVPRVLRFAGRAAAVSSVFLKGAGTCLLPVPCPCLGAGVRRLGSPSVLFLLFCGLRCAFCLYRTFRSLSLPSFFRCIFRSRRSSPEPAGGSEGRLLPAHCFLNRLLLYALLVQAYYFPARFHFLFLLNSN